VNLTKSLPSTNQGTNSQPVLFIATSKLHQIMNCQHPVC